MDLFYSDLLGVAADTSFSNRGLPGGIPFSCMLGLHTFSYKPVLGYSPSWNGEGHSRHIFHRPWFCLGGILKLFSYIAAAVQCQRLLVDRAGFKMLAVDKCI